MKTIRAITIILLLLSFTHVCGQDNLADSPVSSLPSDETYQTIEESSSVPNLRAAPPGENGNPQGLVPVGTASYIGAVLLSLALLSYKQYKTKLTKQ